MDKVYHLQMRGSNIGLFPDLLRANIFFYCFSTAILIHAAILEPHNLRVKTIILEIFTVSIWKNYRIS